MLKGLRFSVAVCTILVCAGQTSFAEGEAKLLEGARTGDSSLIEEGLGLQADVNCKDENGDTPLILAAASGFESIVSRLLEQQGIKIFETNSKGQSALWIASRYGQVEVARILNQKYTELSPIRFSSGDRI